MADEKLQVAPVLAEHYNKTYEYTHRLWQERNRLFVSLLIVTGLSALLALNINGASDLLVYLVAGLFHIPESVNIVDLRTSFPFAIIRIVLEGALFYLMMVLASRTEAITRNYHYLGELEADLRKFLPLEDTEFFTRESEDYAKNRSPFLKRVKFLYIGMITVMLGLLLLLRIHDFSLTDFANLGGVDILVLGAEIVVLIAIGYAFWGYVSASLSRLADS